MAQCETVGCIREGTVEQHIDAPFTMTSSAAESRRKIIICEDCRAQDERMHDIARPAVIGKL